MHLNQIQMVPSAGRNAEQVPIDFFYSRVIEKNEEEFHLINPLDEFNSRVNDLMREQRENIADNLDEFGEPVSTLAQDVLFPSERVRIDLRGRGRVPPGGPTATKYTGDKTDGPILLNLIGQQEPPHRRPGDRRNKLNIAALSQDREDSESFIGFFGDEVHEISTYVGDYVDVKEMKSGGEIVHDYFDKKVSESSNLEGWHEDVEDNAFENEVFESVKEMTSVSLANIRIEVDVGDNPDFDVVSLPLGGFGTNYAVEVKDYAQENNDEVDEKPSVEKDSGELRSELIRKPKDYAEQADLNLISIVKGLSDEQYDNLSRLAESSNVALFNEDNYEENLREILLEQSFREMAEYTH